VTFNTRKTKNHSKNKQTMKKNLNLTGFVDLNNNVNLHNVDLNNHESFYKIYFNNDANLNNFDLNNNGKLFNIYMIS
jgi:hypothetical protein